MVSQESLNSCCICTCMRFAGEKHPKKTEMAEVFVFLTCKAFLLLLISHLRKEGRKCVRACVRACSGLFDGGKSE